MQTRTPPTTSTRAHPRGATLILILILILILHDEGMFPLMAQGGLRARAAGGWVGPRLHARALGPNTSASISTSGAR